MKTENTPEYDAEYRKVRLQGAFKITWIDIEAGDILGAVETLMAQNIARPVPRYPRKFEVGQRVLVAIGRQINSTPVMRFKIAPDGVQYELSIFDWNTNKTSIVWLGEDELQADEGHAVCRTPQENQGI
jgi:hypothetical protein